MSNKGKSSDLGLGDFMVPVIDLMSILIMKVVEFTGLGFNILLNKYIFNPFRV